MTDVVVWSMFAFVWGCIIFGLIVPRWREFHDD